MKSDILKELVVNISRNAWFRTIEFAIFKFLRYIGNILKAHAKEEFQEKARKYCRPPFKIELFNKRNKIL